MYIIPAIDLLGGKCVRLVQGEYHRYITYEENPAKKAKDFKDAGSQWLHVIDLDGAKVGKFVNTDSLRAITQEVKGLKIQVGGGLRNEQAISETLDLGVERVIVGTKAVDDFEWFSDITKKFAGKVVLSLDARGSKIATHGWKKDHPHEIHEMIEKVEKLPLAAIIYTDINKDGMLSGPNLERTKALAQATKFPIIAAGGVTTINDIKAMAQTKVIAAAIVGRALYENTLDLTEAIKTCKEIA